MFNHVNVLTQNNYEHELMEITNYPHADEIYKDFTPEALGNSIIPPQVPYLTFIPTPNLRPKQVSSEEINTKRNGRTKT